MICCTRQFYFIGFDYADVQIIGSPQKIEPVFKQRPFAEWCDYYCLKFIMGEQINEALSLNKVRVKRPNRWRGWWHRLLSTNRRRRLRCLRRRRRNSRWHFPKLICRRKLFQASSTTVTLLSKWWPIAARFPFLEFIWRTRFITLLWTIEVITKHLFDMFPYRKMISTGEDKKTKGSVWVYIYDVLEIHISRASNPKLFACFSLSV